MKIVLRQLSLLIIYSFICLPVTVSHSQSDIRETIVITNPSDRRDIRGNASIALVWGRQIKQPYGDVKSAIINLANAMNTWTDVETTGYSQLSLESGGFTDLPFAVISAEEAFDLTFGEKKNLTEFFSKGGILFCDNALGTVRSSPVKTSFRKIIRSIYGDEARIETLPDSHPVFHSFFDFENGPPKIMRDTVISNISFEGVWHDGRLIAIYSDMGYTVKWSEQSGNILQLKLGVNMIIFALTGRENTDETR